MDGVILNSWWFIYFGTFIGTLLTLMYYYVTSNNDFWDKLNVPYIKPEFVYGNMKEIAKCVKSQNEAVWEFYQYFKKLGHNYGGIFQLRDPVMIICHPQLVKDVLVKNFPHFHDRHIAHDEHFDPLSAHLIALEGSKWKYIRSKLNPAFSTSKLKGMFQSMTNICNELIRNLNGAAEEGKMLDARDFLGRYTVDIIGNVAFGIDVNAMKEDSEFLHMGQKFFEPTQFERVGQIIANTNYWMYKIFKLRMVSKKVTDFFINVVNNTMTYRRKNNVERNDFLHFLMKINETKGTDLKDMDEMKGVKNYNMAVSENSIGKKKSININQ